jgi:Tol biopolymer transport system component
MTPLTQRTVGNAMLLVSILVFTCGFSYVRTVQVDSTPAGANVLIDGQVVGVTPWSQKVTFPKATSAVAIRVEKDRYEAQEVTLTGAEAKEKKSSPPWPLSFNLVDIRREVPVLITSPIEGAKVLIDGRQVGTVPIKQTLIFSRTNGAAKWNAATIGVEKLPQYERAERTVPADEAAAQKPGAEWKFDFPLLEIRREVPLEIRANVEDASVSVDGLAVGKAPLSHSVVFARPNGRAPWPELTLRVEREGYEFRPAGGDGQPAFVRKLAFDATSPGIISANNFVPVTFVLSPLRSFEIQSDRVLVFKTNVLSEVNPNESGRPPTQITRIKPDSALVLSRISTVPEPAEQIVFSVPKREARSESGGDTAGDEIVGANIWMATGAAQTQMTDGRQYDMDPFVTADGRWIYFSSDRLRTRSIWRMPANGRGGFTKITGDLSTIDTEPAVSPDGGRMAYTSRSISAMSTSPNYIWIANADGTLPTQMRAGHSPAWSPDGKLIAFVSTENKIWVMDSDGGNLTQLTLGDSTDCYPVWMPLGKHIIFASNKAQNDLKQRNFDIWMMNADGSGQTQLTVNGSFDSAPAVSSNGKYLYFFSNRGAQRAGQDSLQIFRLDLPAE